MMYFIPWVVFLLFVILSVPIVSMLEKRRTRPAGDAEQDADEPFDEVAEEPLEPADEAADPLAADPLAGDFGATGGDDFSAFDQEFK